MKILSLWSALSPTVNFPFSPFCVTVDKIDYQLPLPIEVADAICNVVHPLKAKIHRIDEYCSEKGLELIRKEPSRLGMAADGKPAYAEAQLKAIGLDPALKRGSVTKRLIVTSHAAEYLLQIARDLALFTMNVRTYLTRHADFLNASGGFEVMTALYFFDDAERVEVSAGLHCDDASELLEMGRQRTRFIDIASGNARSRAVVHSDRRDF